MSNSLSVLLQRAGDWLWGYDFFISYSHGDSPCERDGSHRNQYVKALARELRARRFSVFLDTVEYHPGEDLSAATIRRVRSSKKLILVARRCALQSPWVRQEVETAVAWRREIVVLDINGTFQAASLEHPLRQLIPDVWLRHSELMEDADGEPSAETVRKLHEGFHKVRRETIRQRLIAATAIVLGVLAVLATWAAVEARKQERIAKNERDEAIRRRKVSFAQSLSRDAVRQEGPLAVLLAAEAYHFSQESRAPVRNVVDDSLRTVLQRPAWNAFKLSNEFNALRWSPIAWMPEGNAFVVGSGEQGLQLVELDSHVARSTTFDQSLGVATFRLAGNGKTLVGLVDKQGLRVWNREKPAQQPELIPWEFTGKVWFDISADGSTIIAATPQFVKCWKLGANSEWIELHRFATDSNGERKFVHASISGDGKVVVFGYVESEATLSLWVREIAEGAGSILAYQGPFVSEGGAIFHISRTNKWVIATGFLAENFGPVFVWKRSGQTLQGPWELGSPGEAVASLAFSPDENLLAVGGSHNADGMTTGITICNLTSLTNLPDSHHTGGESDSPLGPSSNQASDQSFRCDTAEVSCLQFSDDSQTLVSADGSLIRVWRKTGEAFDQQHLTLTAHSHRVRSIAVGPNAGWIRAIDDGPTVLHFELATALGAAVPLQEDRYGSTGGPHKCVAWSPDSQTLVAGELGGKTIDIWRPRETRKRLQQITANDVVEDLSFSPDGKYLGAACQDGSVQLWLANGFGSIPGLPSTSPQKGQCSLAFDPVQPRVVLGMADGTVLLRGWQSASTETLVHHAGGVASVTFNSNGTWIASAGKKDNRICLWNARKPIVAPTIVTCPATVVELVFDTTGEALFFVDDAREIQRLVLTPPFTRISLGKGPEGPTCLALNSDGRTLAVGGNHERVQLWDPRQLGHPVELREFKLCFTDLAFSPDGQRLACSSYGRTEDNFDGKLLLYPSLEGLMTSARSAAWRNLTQEEWDYFIAPDIKYRETFPKR